MRYFSRPKVTIGLPVYNAGRFLADALRSIFAQTWTDWELIVVDDGSTDSACDLVERIDDSRVRFYRDGKRQGLSARLNQITRMARGEFLARMDADDMCHPERIEREVKLLQRHPEVDVVSSSIAILDRDDRFSRWRPAPSAHAQICARPLKGFALVHGGMLLRTDWARLHAYNERNRRCEDWQLLISSYRHSRFANLPECLYFYREFDSYRFRKYTHSQLISSRIHLGQLSQYGAAKAMSMIARRLGYITTYAVATGFGLQDTLIRKRSIAIPDSARAALDEAVMTVRATGLPLVDTGAESSWSYASSAAIARE